ncbi:LuxR family transcriptional regulator [Breoghania sp. L-A4]|uniref:helix-turn-helix transcriptional regulator n=1 Tax=Breoghania sp. L-A4 TaxID=2304600 RepID=UPI000E35B871|nr:LuxR family transcriptional regulator [Breoghania sp. L-A4]AXS41407.1 LuxR family transcriptional regulator [Breoghania sp. L-A4]
MMRDPTSMPAMSQFAETWSAASDDHTMADCLRAFCAEFGFSHATYFGTRLPVHSGGNDVLVTTYSSDWISHYVSMDYRRLDPVLSLGSQVMAPLNWADIPRKDPAVRAFFDEAAAFGIGQQGLTVPMKGIFGNTILFSLNAHTGAREWRRYCTTHKHEIVRTAKAMHREIANAYSRCPVGTDSPLSKREVESLYWAAKGKTAWETAKILGLTERTVSFYLKNSYVKLDAASKAHAVAIALDCGLINTG